MKDLIDGDDQWRRDLGSASLSRDRAGGLGLCRVLG